MATEEQVERVAVIRERVGMLDLLARDGRVMRRQGAYWMGLCPFHEERSGSFAVGSRYRDRATCFGCGWRGDIFDYWRATRGTDFKEAVVALGEIAGLARLVEGAGSGSGSGAKGARRLANVGRSDWDAGDGVVKPSLPRLRGLSDGELEGLARLRGLSYEGCALAARGMRQVGACRWPQWEPRGREGSGEWSAARDAGLCWVVTDGAREVAQFRRLDGVPFETGQGRSIKCWTKGSPTWPVGTHDIGDKPGVIWVEGGADLLAGWHFVWALGLQGAVGVVAMLGASCRIRKEALGVYKGKRVRIFMDADAAGRKAALRWQGQLVGAGAAVEVFDLSGLVRGDGAPVKDLNDLALCSREVIESDEVREGLVVWDF